MAKKKRARQVDTEVPPPTTDGETSEETLNAQTPPTGDGATAGVSVPPLPPDLITRPRTLQGDTTRFFQWMGQVWYGVESTWSELEGVAFLPEAHYHAAESIGIAPLQALASGAFFMAQEQYQAECEPAEPTDGQEARAVIESIGVEEMV